MITNTTAKTTYTVAEGVDTYAIGFEFDYNPDSTPQIKVFKNKQPDDALVFGVDYTISPDNLNIIISSGVEVGDRIDIVRNILFRQLSDYIIGRIDPEQIENDFDASVMRDQQLKAYIDNLGELPIDHEERLDAIEAKIPTEATAENQLADKQFVTNITNGKIDENEPIVGGTFTKVQVDTKGLVVEGGQAVLSDISNVTITTPTSGQFLMYDGSDWVNTDSSASVSWGAITGTLSSQTDLQNALNAKSDDSGVVHTTGTETIDGAKTFEEPISVINGSNVAVVKKDSNGVAIGGVHFVDNDNLNGAALLACNEDETDATSISVWWNNGQPFATCPASDIDNSIVCTQAKNKAISGYYKFSNGLIVQWGYGTVGNNGYVNLPTAFTSGVSYSAIANDTSSGVTVATRDYESTRFKFVHSGSGSRNMHWVAIGY